VNITIGRRTIGLNHPPYFIADIASNHDGDLGRALKLIELAKEAGADVAKFQNFQAAKLVSRHGFEALGKQVGHQAAWKKSVFEAYQDASLDYGWTAKLKKHCDEVGIEYMTSPYDFESVDHVDPYVHAFKIGSGDITWLESLEYIGRKGKPVLLATGAAAMQEVEGAMQVLSSVNKQIVLMQCNTNYTASPENFKHINLNVLKTYAARFPGVVLGLSDHTFGPATVLGAVALGGRVFEKHFTDDCSREGQDHKFSVPPAQWRDMVDRANELFWALGDGVKIIEANEQDTCVVQKRALRYTRDLKKGTALTDEDLFPLRPIPAGALSPDQIKNVLGKKILRDVKAQECVMKGDV
jgi:N-acetylneuraminate synthase